ncbi:hypothetical protein N9J91_03445 [Gammaproteobacteria bacterium]|nr:hypothetical protein [Gammaproteobacteria bacterium]
MNRFIIFSSLILVSIPSDAYIGPGMGGGIVIAIIGFFAGIFLALWGILYYPIKRYLKNRREKKVSSKETESNPK